MKTLNTVEMQNVNAGSGYKCSACGKKFYKQYIGKVWRIKIYTKPKDDCYLHIWSTHGVGNAKPKWCW